MNDLFRVLVDQVEHFQARSGRNRTFAQQQQMLLQQGGIALLWIVMGERQPLKDQLDIGIMRRSECRRMGAHSGRAYTNLNSLAKPADGGRKCRSERFARGGVLSGLFFLGKAL